MKLCAKFANIVSALLCFLCINPVFCAAQIAAGMCYDYNGDGKADLVVYESAHGHWYILESGSWSILSGQFGWDEARPVPGDFDGDGKADLAVYHRESGTWYVLYSSTWTLGVLQFGSSAARPVSGDFDGDGVSDFAVYERDTGTWYVLYSSTWTLGVIQFGSSATCPVPADFDGDGKTDLALYDRSEGMWHVQQSSDGAQNMAKFGSSSMAPLPSFNGGATEGLVYLAFGDSITYGTGSSSGGPGTGYPALLDPLLEPAFGGHFASINAGNPGETTAEGLVRFESALAQYNPDIVLLMEGMNDQFFEIPFSQTEANLRSMIITAMGRGVDVVIATIPPVISNQYRVRSAQMSRIQAFNPTIYAIAADYGIPVARVYESITEVSNWEQLLIDQPTANHPNDAGYAVVADAFFGAISEGINAGLFY